MRIIILFLLVHIGNMVSAQGIAGRVKQSAQDAAESTVLNKTSESVSRKTDEILTIRKKKSKSDNSNEIDDNSFNNSTSKKNKGEWGVYSKFDFVPGEDIIYFRDFSNENPGELPYGWNTTGSAAVIKLGDLGGSWLQLHQSSAFITDNSSHFTDNFTIEFDMLFFDNDNGIINYPAFYFGFLASGSNPSSSNRTLQNPDENFLLTINSTIINDGNGNSSFQLRSQEARSQYFDSGQKTFSAFDKMISKPVHVSIQVQKERFRMWLNSEKLYDIPKAVSARHAMNQLYFEVSDNGYSNDQVGIFISNIRIAKGVADVRHKLIDEGIFTTNGILFDVNEASIRPESFAVLKEISDLLHTYPDVNVRIVGHTDSDGNDQNNLILSEKRAESIKRALQVDFGIEASRLQTSGKGESEPIASNNNLEGKAKNRRVEFIKIN